MQKKCISAKKFLSMLLVLAMVLALIPAGVFAVGETKTIYLNAGGGGLWDQAGAWFDAWVWGSSQADAWYTFADPDGDGIYEVEIPADATGMKILRKASSSTTHDWNCWNQTGDLTIGTNNMYTITGWGTSDGKWSTYTPVEVVYTVAGESALCGSNWDITDDANNMVKNASGIYEKVYTDVAAGTYEFKVVRDENWGSAWPSSNYSLTVAEDGSTVTVTFDPATKTVSATAEVPVVPEGVSVYAIASNGWTNVNAYAWTNGGDSLTWPGNPMTKTGESVNGYDVYAITFETAFENVIFNNGSSQTADLVLQAGQYYDLATGTWYASLSDVPTTEEPVAKDYYLVGYINNADYNGEDYKFTDGKLTVTFANDSYVVVKDGSGDWYLCETYCTGTSAVLTKGHSEKMFVAAGTEVTFTLVENGDGTLTLSYAAGSGEEGTDVHYEATFHFANTLGWGVVNLYTWSQGGTALTGGWPGTATSQDADGFYSMTVKYEAPAGQGLNYIFNNGGTQTVDLNLPASAFDENHKAEIWVVLSTQTDGKYNADTFDSGDAIAISPIVKDNSVTFQYKAPSASAVEVRGTMCGWEDGQGVAMTKNSYGIWSVTISDVTPGIHEYKFVADGSWTTDPLNTWTENGNSAFLISDPSKDVNQVTVIVHYNRTDGNYDNWNLYMWNENGSKQYDFTAGEGEVVTTIQVEGRATQSVNFKVRKSVGSNKWAAEEGQVTVDLSTIVSGTIHVYTGGKYSNTQTMEDDVVYANKISDVQYDYENNTVTIYTNKAVSNPETGFGLVKDNAVSGWTYDAAASNSGSYVFKLTDEPQLSALYRYNVRFYEQAEAFHTVNYPIGIDSVYASDKFAAEYTYLGDDLGAAYYASGTTFRLWAPTAEEVAVQLYATGSDSESGAAKLGTYSMQKDVNGTWIVTIDGDLSGVYYTYLVKVNGNTVEANDPYSVSTGVNGKRSMVTDLASTNPDGWYSDSNPNPVTSQTDAVIYELHVRDFSIDDSSGVSAANRGKFLAFTEEGTTVSGKGEIVSGVDYLESLGITHLHLLPVYDYESVDETVGGFNWGYDPQNYNVPEGNYSTNPYDGNVRVNEMKQMVMALHNNGISVVMDVVYNHVYDASTFSFNQIVPGYFSRVDSNTSGCGNDTASEREMVRKYIVDSVLYWTEEYHIDGFRFDLVGLIDVQTINEVVDAVHAVRPDVIFYGEGWDMDGTNKEPGTQMAKQGNASKTPEFAYFSDSMRNGLGGNNEGTATGFASGAGNGGTMVTEWLGNPWWTSNPEQVIQYASCHDNYTLADKIILSTGKSSLDATVVKMNNLAAAFYMTSQGVPFIHAGEELLREKLNADGSRNHNSYNSSDEVNHIEWSNLEKNAYAETSEYYKGLIAFRLAHPALRYNTAALVKDNVQTREAAGNLVVMRIDGNGAGDDDILVIFNASGSSATVTLPEGEWEIYVQGNQAGTEVLGTATGSVTVEGISACVLTKEDQGVDEDEPLGESPEKTIYFSNNKYWPEVYAYAWTDGGETKLLGEWPGTKATFVETNDYGEDIYCITLPASETGIEGLIFNSGNGQQTVDIQPGVDGTGYYCTEADENGHFNVGTYTYRAPQMGGENDYFLGGWINGADYAGADYKFGEDGTLTVTFGADSYVYVVNGTGSTTYMTDGWLGSVTEATLYDSTKLTNADKLMIPGGVEVNLTLIHNDDGTKTLSYTLNVPSVEDGTGIQDGLTLHCWNWSFAEIEANMATIAAQGYTAIQTSPVQALKEATNRAENTVHGNWWVYYQPVDFVITTDSGNALGTKAELESMIATAHQYGVQVIVDVVANHLGNQTGNDLSDKIPEYLRGDEFWHDITTNTTNWDDRYDITQHCMSGLPDLNTSNKELQNIVLDFLCECVDAGVDGFRFDGAKHIETPMDDASFASDFWPTVVGGAEAYAQTTYGKDLYIYGELLDTTGGVSLTGYTQYMAVTDNSWGNSLRKNIEAGNAALAAGYDKAADASALVLWAESHDTFMTDDAYLYSGDTSEENIIKTWALVAARKDAMGLYFARPESLSQAIGVASVTGWANDEVAEINKFHNAFAGQSEVVSNESGISYVERGTSGVVLVQVAQTTRSTQVSVTAHAMADGTYVDQITGSIFTVENGTISGQIGDTGVAVVYNRAAEETFENTVADAEGGTVSVDNTAPTVGETVTVTATPDEDMVVGSVTVTDDEGNEVSVTDNGDGTYSFSQPASPVTITVKFVDGSAPSNGDNTHLALWISLLNLSVLAIAVLLLTQPRKKYHAKYEKR